MTGRNDVTVAVGDFLYEVERPWNKSNGGNLGTVSGIACSERRLYALLRQRPFVVAFDMNGRIVQEFPEVDARDGHGLSLDGEGNFWISDRDGHRVLGYNAAGKLVASVGDIRRPRPFGPMGHPTKAIVGENGNLFIADGYADALVHEYSLEGDLMGSWGSPGRGRGQFRTPHSLCDIGGGRLAVADRDNDRVQFLSIGENSVDILDDFVKPMDLCVDIDGRLLVTEQAPRLSAWSSDGELLGRCRIPSTSTHGIAVDTTGDIFLSELVQGVITRLRLLQTA